MYKSPEPNETEAQPPAEEVGTELAESADPQADADVWPPFTPTVRQGHETKRPLRASAQLTTTVLHRPTARKTWRGVGARGLMAQP